MSRCTDNPATGRIGCGATFGGERQHVVARVPWSQHADGIAHETFSTLANVDRCWRDGIMHDPRTVTNRAGEHVLFQGDDGVWRGPSRETDR